VDTTYATPLAGSAPAAPPNWLTTNLVFSSFVSSVDGTSTIDQIVKNSGLPILSMTVGVWGYTDVSGILVYGRVRSGQTGLSAGTREGGFALSTAPLALLSMNSGASLNNIFGNRSGTPIVMADLFGSNFGIVAGFYQGDATLRKPFMDAMYLTLNWSAGGSPRQFRNRFRTRSLP
jgi:hypothetical protein